jgi:hypothetical protein
LDLYEPHQDVKDNKPVFWFLESFKVNDGKTVRDLDHRSGTAEGSSLPRFSQK